MISLYLAASWGRKSEIKAFAQRIWPYAHVTSTWFDEPDGPHGALGGYEDGYLAALAWSDCQQIRDADALVLFGNDPKTPTPGGGRHVEFGYALGLGKRLFLVGPQETNFAHLPEVRRFETKDDLVAYLADFNRGQNR